MSWFTDFQDADSTAIEEGGLGGFDDFPDNNQRVQARDLEILEFAQSKKSTMTSEIRKAQTKAENSPEGYSWVAWVPLRGLVAS